MTKKPPADTAEAPDDIRQAAEGLLAEIAEVTAAMHALAGADQTAEMAQLVIRRGNLVDALLKLKLEALAEADRMAILEKLNAIRKLDDGVDAAMAGIVGDIERQLLGIHEGKQVLKEYRITGDPERHESTRSDRA